MTRVASLILLAAICSAVTVYRKPHYSTKTTKNVAYTKTLVKCANQTDQSTCTEVDMVLDVWQPTNTTGNEGPFPIVMSVHGGAFVSGDQEDKDPPNAFFAERGFVAFAIQYRLTKDKGLYPMSLKGWSPKNTNPHAQWTPYIWAMYPAVRDIKAALRWIHAHASEYNADTSSITLQGGSAGATAVIELALTGGDEAFAGDYTSELQGMDRTLSTANLDQPATANGLIDYWGGIFTEDLMSFKDGKPRYTASSLPTIAFHGTDDTIVSPETGEILCGNLTAVGVPCKLVHLAGQKHGCWNAVVTLPSGSTEPIFEYAFDWMADISNWTVIGPAPGNCSAEYKQCGGTNWHGTTCCNGRCTCTGTEYHKQCKPPAGGGKC